MSSATRQSSHASRTQSTSSTTSSSRGDRSSRPQHNPAIESAVTRLLVSIKSLLETLTSWSQGNKSENDVSDVYVRLGNDFNAAVSAFGTFRIDMTELNAIPDELRGILESCLAEDACQQTLDVYLPDVRKIITKLLQGLRAKQSIYRQVVSERSRTSTTPESGGTTTPEGRASRNSRRDTSSSTRSNPRNTLESSDSLSRRSATLTRKKDSVSANGPDAFIGGFAMPVPDAQPGRSSTPVQSLPRRDAPDVPGFRPPSRTSSVTAASIEVQREQSATPQPPDVPPIPRPPSVTQPQVPSHVKRYSLVDRPLSATTPPPTASSPSPPPPAVPPPPSVIVDEVPGLNGVSPHIDEPPPFLDSPPPDGPAVQSSLAALKQSDALERRASKRFSTYNISKMTGGSIRGQNRRSMAVSSSLTPGDLAVLTEENEEEPSPTKRSRGKSITQRSRGPSPIAEDDEGSPVVPPLPSASRSPSPLPPQYKPEPARELPPPPTVEVTRAADSGTASPTGPFPVFLQVGRDVKKVNIERGLSFASLRVLFVDKFSYSPGQGNFPAIYIRDPSSGVQYELEDMEEVKERCLLSLNIEPLDQIKQHIDTQISSLSQDIKDLRTFVSNNNRRNSIQPPPPIIVGQPLPEGSPPASRPSDRQFRNVARRLSRILPEAPTLDAEKTPRVTPEPVMPQTTGTSIQPQMTGASVMSDYSTRVASDLKTQFDEVQNLRRDIGIMRQLYTDFMKQTKESLGTLRTQTQNVRQLSSAKVGGARAYIDDGKTKLDSRSQNVLTKMEELQDVVEAIKEDVLKRNISPRPQALKQVKSDIDAVTAELQSLKDHIQTVKPMWKKTWEEELQNIVEEQQFLSHQEEFLSDLLEDHKAVLEVYGHVEKVISLRGTGSGKARGGKTFRPPPPPGEGHGGISTVMMEIRGGSSAGDRMKAIEATERARAKQLENREDEFQSELAGFVGGKKLKLTGGAEEIERVRQKKNDMTLKAMFTGGSGTASPSANGDATPTNGAT